MRNTRSKYRAKQGLTFVLEPFLHPVACGVAKREFVEDIGKDLSAQRVLDVKHRFPVAMVEISQGSVVRANGSGDGEGGRGHGGAQRIGAPWCVLLCSPPYCCMASDLLLVDWFTAHNGTFDRSALAFAQIDSLGRGAFALRDLQVQPHLFFFFSLLLETRSTHPAATAARPHAVHPAPPSHSLNAHLFSPPSDRRSRLEEAWPRRRLGRPHPLPHVGGCSGPVLKVVNLSWYGRVHSAHAWPPVEPTIKASLPIAFDTPMFWSSGDLEQLRGTAVLGRSPYSNSPPRVLMLRCRQDRERAGRERLLGQSRSVT